jgi:hypothetical protein
MSNDTLRIGRTPRSVAEVIERYLDNVAKYTPARFPIPALCYGR